MNEYPKAIKAAYCPRCPKSQSLWDTTTENQLIDFYKHVKCNQHFTPGYDVVRIYTFQDDIALLNPDNYSVHGALTIPQDRYTLRIGSI